jgi:hypothetical protein
VNFKKKNIKKINVLKPGSAWRADPGLGPVRVEAKTRLGIGLGKPGQTRV